MKHLCELALQEVFFSCRSCHSVSAPRVAPLPASQVVGVPCNAEALLVYDPLSQECIGIPTTYHATGPNKRLGYIDSFKTLDFDLCK